MHRFTWIGHDVTPAFAEWTKDLGFSDVGMTGFDYNIDIGVDQKEPGGGGETSYGFVN